MVVKIFILNLFVTRFPYYILYLNLLHICEARGQADTYAEPEVSVNTFDASEARVPKYVDVLLHFLFMLHFHFIVRVV